MQSPFEVVTSLPSTPLNTMSSDDVDMSVTDGTPSESIELSSYERQQASLKIYLNSLPYECESTEEMQEKLEQIVGKIFVCAKAKNWLVLSTWDGMLQWYYQLHVLVSIGLSNVYFRNSWLLMRYPMQKSTRAKLVRLYYELCLLPGMEPRVIRSWSDMLNRLLANKPGNRRKLEDSDLELPWLPLWRVLQKELWPKQRAQDSS